MVQGENAMRKALSIAMIVPLLAAAVAGANEAPLTVDQGHVADYWARTHSEGKGPALYPKAAKRAGASGCVAVAFTIDAEGKAVAPHVLSSYITKKDGDDLRAAFEKSVLENVPHWRYVAASDRPQPIHTYVTITAVAEIGLHRKTVEEEIAAHCKVDNFATAAVAPPQERRQ